MASSTACKAFCTILSLGELIPRGRVLPFALGISTLRLGLNSKVPLFRDSDVLTNHSQFNPSIVYPSDPGVMLPFFLAISS
jgi:hypothetical protein